MESSGNSYIHLMVVSRLPSLVESHCAVCNKSLGVSPNPAFLRIAEKAHKCNGSQQSSSRPFLIMRRDGQNPTK